MKRIKIIKRIIIFSFCYLLINLYMLQIIDNSKYMKKYMESNIKTLKGDSAPRGRIYDRNGKLLVDNKPVRIIYYKKEIGISKKEELRTLKKLSKLIEIDTTKVTNNILKDYYINTNNTNNLINEEEWEKYENRLLNDKDIYKLKLERITNIDEINKEEAYLYYLMNKGYIYDEKIIKENPTDYEYAKVAEQLEKLKGVNVKISYERSYIYGDTLKSIYGSIGNITKELENSYNTIDPTRIVGTSYLEYQYNKYLEGKDNLYQLNNNKLKIIEYGKKGNDIYLTIDIDLQMAVERIIEEQILKAKKELNTKFLDKAYVIITNPQTGEILAMSGKILKNNEFYDYTRGIITNSVTVGSTIKGASHIVGYNNNGLKIGEIRNDKCIKIKSTPEKCSFRYLGTLNDITALKYSSNTYQFHTAIKVGNGNYYYNGPLKLNLNAYDIYRKTFKEFGLGTTTGIDLPNEKIGYIGDNKESGHILDLAIGQYDTYTPIELSQYIQTIANDGNRLRPYLVKYVKNNNNKIIYENKKEVLNKVTTEKIYMDRVKLGLREVLTYGGTGSGYININYKPAGKTGTSQSFIDTNGDNMVDTETISTAFVGYAPYDNPKVTFTIINPDVAVLGNSDYVTFITKRIVNNISNVYFSIYNN